MSALPRPPRRGRASWRGLACAASLALCLAGFVLLLRGLTVPLVATVAQVRLEQEFEQRLAAVATARQPGPVASAPVRPVPAPRPVSGGPIARLSIERLEVERFVLASDGSPEQLDLGPTMLKRGGRDAPVTVLTAHRDTHFLFIRDLREGDEVTLHHVTGELERYRIDRFETVRWDEFAYPLDPARPLLALATCYPFGGTEYGGPWRRVAWAQRIG